MIGFLRGVLFEKGSGYIIIDVGGVGYEVSVPANSGAYLSSEGEEVMIYTTMIVREDDVSLYGFSRKGELDAFKKLITVNGVGAKAGISILSAFTMEQLQQAIVFEDVKALTKANGIGKKTAERIVLELKDKVKDLSGGVALEGIPQPGGPSASGNASQAVNALVTLGYSASEAAAAVGKLDSSLSPEELIRLALKSCGSGK